MKRERSPSADARGGGAAAVAAKKQSLNNRLNVKNENSWPGYRDDAAMAEFTPSGSASSHMASLLILFKQMYHVVTLQKTPKTNLLVCVRLIKTIIPF